jgi:tRNA A37 N6-isopentenylltransferase MiaA
VRRALRRPISRTAWNIHGLRPIAELPRREAELELVRITRRYARYQRKWMRHVPGIVMVDADRPARVVADEIVALLASRLTAERNGTRAVSDLTPSLGQRPGG